MYIGRVSVKRKQILKLYLKYIGLLLKNKFAFIRKNKWLNRYEFCFCAETFDPVRGDETLGTKCEPIAPFKVFKEIYMKTRDLDKTFTELWKQGYAVPW